MKEKEATKWKSQRRVGRNMYMAKMGAGFALGMFLAMTVFDGFEGREDVMAFVVENALKSVVVGLLFGVLMWFIMERGYRKYVEAHGEPGES